MRVGMIEREAPSYRAGRSSAVPLVQENIIHALLVVLRGTLNVAGGTGAGNIHADAAERLLRDFTLKANGEVFQSYDGRFLYYLFTLLSNGGGYPQEIPANLAAGSAHDVVARFLIPFFMPWSETPHDFALPSALVGSPTVAFTFGGPEDMVYGAVDGDLTLDDVVVELYEQPVFGSQTPAQLFQGLQVASFVREIAQSGTIKVSLDTLLRGMKVRGVLIIPDAGGAGGDNFVANADVIESVRFVVDGKAEWERIPFSEIQARNAEAYGLVETLPVAFIDAAENKRTRDAGDLWTINTVQKPYVELDVAKQAGENRVTVYVLYSDPLIGRR